MSSLINQSPHLFSGKILTTLAISSLLLAGTHIVNAADKKTTPPIALVIHGGAGVISKDTMTPEKEKLYREKLEEALTAGHTILKKGGSSLDAVEAAIMIMEDSPLFNAGKGAVYTNEEKHELDASIMNGKTLEAGAVAGVTTIKNPIRLARAVMEKSKHVLMVSKGAEAFAKEQGFEMVDNSYFDTEHRLEQLRKLKEKVPDAVKYSKAALDRNRPETMIDDHKFGTVGAVALDVNGNLAAGTSTGGMTNKLYGRVGDSPIIGAGTYANNASCAVSATGHGEFFIRSVVAYDICALKLYKNISLSEAAKEVVQNKLVKMGGEGGIISMDAKGSIVTEFNSPGMFRGSVDINGKRETAIYK